MDEILKNSFQNSEKKETLIKNINDIESEIYKIRREYLKQKLHNQNLIQELHIKKQICSDI